MLQTTATNSNKTPTSLWEKVETKHHHPSTITRDKKLDKNNSKTLEGDTATLQKNVEVKTRDEKTNE